MSLMGSGSRKFIRRVRTPLADILLMESERGDCIERERSPDGQFWLVSSGRWRFKADGAASVLGALDLAYSAPGEPCLRTAEDRLVAFGVQVRYCALERFPENAAWLNPVSAVPWDARRSMLRLMRSFLATASDDHDLEDQVVLLLDQGRPCAPESRPPQWLLQAREILQDDAPESQSLYSLAMAIGISPAHLSSSFRTAFGVPLSIYRRRVRIQKALAQAASGRGTLNVAAIEAGFYDASHFHRACISELGMEPSALRKIFPN